MSRIVASPPRRPAPRHRSKPRYGFRRLMAILLLLSLGVLVWRSGAVGSLLRRDKRPSAAPRSSGFGHPNPRGTLVPTHTGGPSPSTASTPGPINTSFPGLTTFRGNATRDY